MLECIDPRRAQASRRTRRITEDYSTAIQESRLTRLSPIRQINQEQSERYDRHNDLDDSINDTGEN
jgi:hypothetical protein